MPEKCIKDHVASADASVAHQPPKQTKLTKMKSMILVALALVAVVAAAPAADEPVAILRSNYDQQPEGGYQYGFEAENGINRDETGEVRRVKDEDNNDHDVIVVRGSYSYPSEDGIVTITYYADESGFHAEGDSIPKVASS